MPHTAEWKIRLSLFEEEGTTEARAVLNTGTAEFSGRGTAHRNPEDTEVPEIGDELAAGRAMLDLGRRLVGVAQRDIADVAAHTARRQAPPPTGWPLPGG